MIFEDIKTPKKLTKLQRLKLHFLKKLIVKEIENMANSNISTGNILSMMKSNKRNLGLIITGLSLILDAVAPFIQMHIPFPLGPVSIWMKGAGGTLMTAGGVHAIKKGT